MAEPHAPRQGTALLDALQAFLLGADDDLATLSRAQIRQALRAEGIDPAPLARQVRDRLATMRAAEELAQAHRRRQQLLALWEHLPHPPAAAKDAILARLRELAPRPPAIARVYFRKFATASEADVHSLLADLHLLEAMERHDADAPHC